MTLDAVDRWKQLSALYEEADELAPEALPGWLDGLRAQGHPLLDPLRKMLQARERVQQDAFLDTLPPLQAQPPASQADIAAGDRIGPWRLLHPLGSGGMAEVWLAQRDDGAYQRRVALKLLHRHVSAMHRETFLARFARERDILASLHHAHIAALFDAGITPQGHPWLALEHVQGEPITTACDRRRLTLRQRVALFQKVLQAVQHAHANLVVHRDLKPGNILVTGDGEVKLLDFGIAKLAEAEGGALAETELTRLDGRPLTPAYAAPEQLQGLPLSTSCDVYSLGVVLYELLTGLRPYEPKAETPALLEQAILEVDPRAPSRRELTAEASAARGGAPAALRRQLAADLDAIVLRALAKQPAQRYASVESLRADVQRWLDGEPVTARTPSALYRARKFAGRHRVGVALGTLAVAGLAGLAVTATLFALQARQESARAVASRDFMVDIFRRADPEKARGASITAGEMLDVGRREISQRLQGQPALQIEMLGSIADILADMADYARSDPARAEVTRLAEQLGKYDTAARSELKRSVELVSAGQNLQAEVVLAGAERLLALAPQSARLRFEQRFSEAVVANVQGRYDEAAAKYAQALDLARTAHGPHSRELLMVLRGQAVVAWRRGDHARSMALHERIASQLPAMPFMTQKERLDIAFDRVAATYSAGRYGDAWTLGTQALADGVREVGRWDATCRLLRRNRAMSALRLGEADRLSASDLADLRADAAELKEPVPALAALQTLLRVRAAQGAPSRELAELREEVEQRLKSGPQGTTVPQAERLAARLALTESWLREGKSSMALLAGFPMALDGELSPIWQARFGVLIGVYLSQSGQHERAIELLSRSVAIFEHVQGEGHAATQLAAINLAQALASAGRSEEALQRLAVAVPRLREDLGPASRTVQIATSIDNALRSGAPHTARPRANEFFN